MNETSKLLVRKMDVISEVEVGLIHRGVWDAAHVGDHVVHADLKDGWFGGNGMLTGLNRSGATLDEAIQNLWANVTNPPEGCYVVIDAFNERKAYRWDNDIEMWRGIDEDI